MGAANDSSDGHPRAPSLSLVPRLASPTHVLTPTQQAGPGQPDLFCLLSETGNSGQPLLTPDSCSPLTKKETQLWCSELRGAGRTGGRVQAGRRNSESQHCTAGRGSHGSRGRHGCRLRTGQQKQTWGVPVPASPTSE